MIPHLHTQLCCTPHDEVCTRGECIFISKCNPDTTPEEWAAKFRLPRRYD